MKKYNVLFLMTVQCALFSVNCSEKSNVYFCQQVPDEVQEKIIYYALISADNLFFSVAKLQRVCRAWQGLSLNKDRTIVLLINNAKWQNKKFFSDYKDYVEGYSDPEIYINYNFFNTNIFDTSMAWSFIKLAFACNDFYALQKLLPKENVSLNDILLNNDYVNKIVHQGYVCTCADDGSICTKKSTYVRNDEKEIIDIILHKKENVSNDCKFNLFKKILNNGCKNYCMLRRLLPIFKVDEPTNAAYYFEYILKKLYISFPRNSFDDRLNRMIDTCLSPYLSILIDGNADLSYFDTENGKKKLNLLYDQSFPKMQHILANTLKKQ